MATDFSDLAWITGFTKSFAESIPEVFGVAPSTGTLQFRQDNPVSGFASEALGWAIPYGGWYKAASKIPKLVKAVDSVGDIVAKPISTGFKREVVKLAPFEAARVGTAQIIGDETLSAEVGESILNLALAGGVGSLIHGVAAAGTREASLPTIFPGLDIAAPAALQARHMKGLLDTGTIKPELLPKANLAFKNTLKEARTQELGKVDKYVAPLQGDTISHPPLKGLDRDINRWFRPTHLPGDKALQVRAFSRGADKNFNSPDEWIAEADLAGVGGPIIEGHHIDPPWTYGQYFRAISFNPTRSANMPRAVDNRITKGFEAVGDNWFMIREADDGMFVMAKKYQGSPGKAESTDKWLLFKTDQPNKFIPDNKKWADATVALNKWIPEASVDLDYGLAGNVIKGYMREVPFRNYQMLSKPGIMDKVIDRLGPLGDNELAHRLKETFREYFTPRQFQFTKVPRANYITQSSKLGYDYAQGVVNELMNGTISLDAGKSVFFGYLNNVKGSLGLPPIRDVGRSLSQEEFANVFENFIRKGSPLEKAEEAFKAGDLTENGLNFLKALQAADDLTTTNVGRAEKATGRRPTQWLKGHYGWSHVWEGDTRIPLLDEKGALRFLAGGPNKKAAQKMAEEVLEQNPSWKLGESYSKSELIERGIEKLGKPITDEVAAAVLAPSFVMERSGVGGYKWFNKNPTMEEFLEDYSNNLLQRWRYQTNLSLTDLMMPHLDKLKKENPAAFKQAVDRINADAGVQGKFGRAVNKFVDEQLGPIIGEQGATKIVGYTNTAMYNLHLGAMNLSFPAVNLLQFVQTTLPEVAFVLNALPENKAPYYTAFLAGGVEGPKGAMAVLQPLKLAGRALSEMRSPSQDVADALAWAMNNRTLDPRMVENYIGEASQKVGDIYRLAKGEIATKDFQFGSWIRALSEWLPGNSERLARTHSYVMGYLTARDLLRKGGQKLTEQQMRTFAQQFTNKTMYLYSAADKPKILTSPVGSGLGLFKNWMFNYMASMGQYTQEAFLRRNFAPLVWQTAGTFAMGGLASTPIYWAADVFAKAFTGNDAMTVAYDEFGEGADGIMYGLPALLSGVSFYSQVQAPGSNPSRDAVMLFDSVIWDRMRAIQGAVGGAIDHWQATGTHPGHDPQTRLQLARALAPSTIYRTMATTTDGDILSPTTGYPLVKGMSFYEQALYRLKLNPVDVDKAFAVSNKLYEQREERRKSIAQLGEAFTNAQMRGDGAEMALIMRQAMVWGVDASSVLKSAMVRTSKHQEDMLSRSYKPEDILKYRNVIGD